MRANYCHNCDRINVPIRDGKCLYCGSYNWGPKDSYYQEIEEQERQKAEHDRRMAEAQRKGRKQ